MQSTNLTDNEQTKEETFFADLETDKVESRGFLVVVVLMLVIYMLAPRPALYDSIKDWGIQLFQLLAGALT